MYKTTTYIVLLLFCAQALMAGIDVHTLEKGGSPVDIVHHYIDTHSKQFHCDFDEGTLAAISFSEYVDCQPSEHLENSHHGCSGHLTALDYDNLVDITPLHMPFRASFNYLANYCSVSLSPTIRPPID